MKMEFFAVRLTFGLNRNRRWTISYVTIVIEVDKQAKQLKWQPTTYELRSRFLNGQLRGVAFFVVAPGSIKIGMELKSIFVCGRETDIQKKERERVTQNPSKSIPERITIELESHWKQWQTIEQCHSSRRKKQDRSKICRVILILLEFVCSWVFRTKRHQQTPWLRQQQWFSIDLMHCSLHLHIHVRTHVHNPTMAFH